jgi:outer membrane biosynthesis protein TonB
MNDDTKRLVGSELWLAALLLTAGLAIAGLSLARLHAQHQLEMAQATGTPGQPSLATPSPQRTNEQPAEAKPGGTRPTTPAPEPARPDLQAQKEGAKPALPPAPAEKMAPPIPERK